MTFGVSKMSGKNYSIDLQAILEREVKTITDKKQEYKSKLSQEEYEASKRGLEYRILDENRKTRNIISWILVGISIGWLIFTGVVFILIGSCVLDFSDGGQITFVAGSLVEVFALWKISLQYFYKN